MKDTWFSVRNKSEKSLWRRYFKHRCTLHSLNPCSKITPPQRLFYLILNSVVTVTPLRIVQTAYLQESIKGEGFEKEFRNIKEKPTELGD